MYHLNNEKNTQFIWNVMSHIKQWMYNSYRVPYQFHRLRIEYNGAIISMNNRISIRVMFYLLHLYLFSDTAVQRDLMWCRICQPFPSRYLGNDDRNQI
jgi:hypothetical protein